MMKFAATLIIMSFVFTMSFPVTSSAESNKNQTVPAPDTSLPPDIATISNSSAATTSSNELPAAMTPVVALGDVTNSPSPIIRDTIDNDPRWWKTSERFEIGDIDGYNGSYDEEEHILFYVSGKSDKMDVTKENGFYVAAGLDNRTDNAGDIAAVKYDSDKRAWRVMIVGKRDNSKQYEVSIHLACGGGANSPCATVYGNGTIINKILLYQAK